MTRAVCGNNDGLVQRLHLLRPLVLRLPRVLLFLVLGGLVYVLAGKTWPSISAILGIDHEESALNRVSKRLPGDTMQRTQRTAAEEVKDLLSHTHYLRSPCQNMTSARKAELKVAYKQMVQQVHAQSKVHDDEIEERQKHRRERWENVCREYAVSGSDGGGGGAKRKTRKQLKSAGSLGRRDLVNLFVSDRHKAIYCSIPKTGCANWKKVLKVLEGRDIFPGCSHLNHLKDFSPLALFNQSAIEYRLKHYFKFTFVREPMSRLVSAFLDKMSPNGTDPYFGRAHSRVILKFLNALNLTLRAKKVSFKLLVQFILKVPKTYNLNEHWQSMWNLCHPCSINYDFVGLYSHLSEESNYVLRKIGAERVAAFPQRQSFYVTTASSAKVEALFNSLPEYLRSKLLRFYEHTYKLMGFRYGS